MDAADPRFHRAVRDFNEGRYFEAHELWEEIWKEVGEGGELRLFYQGLIQVAAGYHKLPRLHLRGARTLLERGLEKLSRYPASFRRIDLEGLHRAVQEDLRRLGGLEEACYSPDLFLWPKIRSAR